MAPTLVTLYHDIEQDCDSEADPALCRRMVTELLAIERAHGIRVTYNVVGELLERQPDLADEIRRAGHEIACHSYAHPPDWGPKHYAVEIERSRAAAPDAIGYRSPRSEWDRSALAEMWRRGFLWNAEADRAPEPYFAHEGLVRLPIETDDWELHAGAVPASRWVDDVGRRLGRRGYTAVGTHDSVTSFAPEERLRAWEAIVREATRCGPVLPFGDVADLYRRAMLAHYYDAHATWWNRATRSLYRTRRFREIIAEEASKLPEPVVVDLGSGGGVLTAGLADRVAALYCVDAAPAMLEDVVAHPAIRTVAGDATDAGLPDRSADLVVAARVLEYLTWPERLAAEIRRIGKAGATFVVTVPASRTEAGPPGRSVPDRLRRTYTLEALRGWAEPIGPGRAFGVHYLPGEPGSEEEEEAYRAAEASPEAGATPSDWVFVGSIAPGPVPPRRAIVSVGTYRFRGRPGRFRRMLPSVRRSLDRFRRR